MCTVCLCFQPLRRTRHGVFRNTDGLVGEVRQTEKDKQHKFPPSGNNNKLRQDCLKIEERLIEMKIGKGI